MQVTYGLIGEKLGHSFSPMIHEEFGNDKYTLIPMASDKLKSFICDESFKGVNITIPYKETVMEYCDNISEEAKEIGCVNVLIKNAEGVISGYNTDTYGMMQLLKYAKISVKGKKVLILGGGGTSLTAKYVTKKLKAKEVVVVSRKGPVNYDNLSEHTDTQVIIDTTSVGMYPNNDGTTINLADFPLCEGVIDVVYNPLKSDLILAAEKIGICCAGGLYMLVAQAHKAAELFMDKKISGQEVEMVYHRLERHIKNIVLVGMPGCGKSTIGQKLSSRLNKTFVDTDKLIEQRARKTIAEIFREDTEIEFRKLESEIIAEVAKCSGQIISTGGGVILNDDNVRRLQQNAMVYFIDRDINELATKGRPLSEDQEALQKLYETRLPRYKEAADKIMKNDTSIEAVVRRIGEVFNEDISD